MNVAAKSKIRIFRRQNNQFSFLSNNPHPQNIPLYLAVVF